MACPCCKKKTGLMTYTCVACKFAYCVTCRLPEDHQCPRLQDHKKEKMQELKEKLLFNGVKESDRYMPI